MQSLVDDDKLGICCPKGSKYCSRCASNLEIHNITLLMERVACGLKPVGGILTTSPDPLLVTMLEARGLKLLQTGRRHEKYLYAFSTPENASKHMSDFINLKVLKEHFGLVIEDKTLEEHVQSDAFLREEDTFVERGIVYGYPLRGSIELDLQ